VSRRPGSGALLLRVLFQRAPADPLAFCHRPILIRDRSVSLGEWLTRLQLEPDGSDDVIDQGIILVWGERRWIIIGADILGRMLRGIATRR